MEKKVFARRESPSQMLRTSKDNKNMSRLTWMKGVTIFELKISHPLVSIYKDMWEPKF